MINSEYMVYLQPMKLYLRHWSFAATLIAVFGLLFASCTEEIDPVFEFTEGLLFVDGRILDEPGASVVTINRNEVAFGSYRLLPVDDATVESQSGAGDVTRWERTDDPGEYRPPGDWKAEPGTSYRLNITTAAGEVVESVPETLPRNVPFQNPRVEFEQEAYFNLGLDRFVPAFFFLVDLPDPAGERNYYQYQSTTYQKIEICKSCVGGVLREGQCVSSPGVQRYDYFCDAPCWASKVSGSTTLVTDEFNDGLLLEGTVAHTTPYDRPGRLLFVVNQYNISAMAFEYYGLIRDLAEGSGGLNAPLPAALVGNLSDRSELRTPVLGFVGVASINTERLMILRESFGGTSLPYDAEVKPDPDQRAPLAPCEGPNKTRAMPEGWVD